MTRAVVVTGASGGIGRETVREFAPDHDIVVHYHGDDETASALVDDVRARGNRSIAVRADLGDRDEVADLFDRARAAFDGVDVLVNNAGVPPERGFADGSPERIDRQLGVNLTGAIYCSQEVVERMAEREYGRIVNVASTAGAHGSPSDPIYGASKGGLIALTKSLAKRYTGDGVRTNAVAPSVTDTPLLAAERRDDAREHFPEGRIVEPAEVAAAIRFLVSEAYSSGKVIEIAGGRYL